MQNFLGKIGIFSFYNEPTLGFHIVITEQNNSKIC